MRNKVNILGNNYNLTPGPHAVSSTGCWLSQSIAVFTPSLPPWGGFPWVLRVSVPSLKTPKQIHWLVVCCGARGTRGIINQINRSYMSNECVNEKFDWLKRRQDIVPWFRYRLDVLYKVPVDAQFDSFPSPEFFKNRILIKVLHCIFSWFQTKHSYTYVFVFWLWFVLLTIDIFLFSFVKWR